MIVSMVHFYDVQKKSQTERLQIKKNKIVLESIRHCTLDIYPILHYFRYSSSPWKVPHGHELAGSRFPKWKLVLGRTWIYRTSNQPNL